MSELYWALVILISASGSPTELSRELIPASAPAVCQAHADKLAEKRRAIEAETLRRFGGRIVGECKKVAS